MVSSLLGPVATARVAAAIDQLTFLLNDCYAVSTAQDGQLDLRIWLLDRCADAVCGMQSIRCWFLTEWWLFRGNKTGTKRLKNLSGHFCVLTRRGSRPSCCRTDQGECVRDATDGSWNVGMRSLSSGGALLTLVHGGAAGRADWTGAARTLVSVTQIAKVVQTLLQLILAREC